jgi:hypothetical protein
MIDGGGIMWVCFTNPRAERIQLRVILHTTAEIEELDTSYTKYSISTYAENLGKYISKLRTIHKVPYNLPRPRDEEGEKYASSEPGTYSKEQGQNRNKTLRATGDAK